MIRPVSQFSGWGYRHIGKPLLFLFPADVVHQSHLDVGEIFDKATPLYPLFSAFYRYNDPILEQTVNGIHFANPIGLSAGFDYNAQLTHFLPSLGFGWQSVGTVTAEAYGGNPRPLLGRLPLSQSLWVNKGFMNIGAQAIHDKLEGQTFPGNVGISVGATNRKYHSEAEQIHEYELAFERLAGIKNAYWELNISCPNLAAGNDFQQPASLGRLLSHVDKLKLDKPVFLKMPIDIDTHQLYAMLDVITQHKIQGIIIGNLTKKADPSVFFMTERSQYDHGGFSGRPVREKSTQLIRAARDFVGTDFTIIGTGGVFNGRHAYDKIRAGANLVQLITGMIFNGPQVIGEINYDLAQMLKQDGFQSISEAVGVE